MAEKLFKKNRKSMIGVNYICRHEYFITNYDHENVVIACRYSKVTYTAIPLICKQFTYTDKLILFRRDDIFHCSLPVLEKKGTQRKLIIYYNQLHIT